MNITHETLLKCIPCFDNIYILWYAFKDSFKISLFVNVLLMHYMTCFKINYQRRELGVISIINTNKIFINGTLNSHVTKLSNSGVATFSKTHIRIQDVKVLFAAEVGKWFRFVLLHMVMVHSLLQGNAKYDGNRTTSNNFLKVRQ